jgi:hypothetical protein
MIWAGHVVRMGDRRSAYRILVGISGVKRPLGRPKRRWEDNMKMNLQYVGWEAWAGFLWPRTGSGVGHLRMRYELSGSINEGSFLTG